MPCAQSQNNAKRRFSLSRYERHYINNLIVWNACSSTAIDGELLYDTNWWKIEIEVCATMHNKGICRVIIAIVSSNQPRSNYFIIGAMPIVLAVPFPSTITTNETHQHQTLSTHCANKLKMFALDFSFHSYHHLVFHLLSVACHAIVHQIRALIVLMRFEFRTT